MVKDVKVADKGPVATAAAASAGGLAETHKGSTALAPMNFESDAGQGMEGADKDSFAVPFLLMLQGLSPAVNESLVDGAKAGMMMNSVTNELFSSARVIPCGYKRVYLRWKPRDEGGGFKGEMSVTQFEQLVREGKAKEVENSKGDMVWKDHEGCELKDTRVHFCLLLTPDGGAKPIIISMGSTQIKRSRRWMTRMGDIVMKRGDGSSYTPATYSHVYTLKSEKEDNEKGTWFSYNIDMEGPVADPSLYEKAKGFHSTITAGR